MKLSEFTGDAYPDTPEEITDYCDYCHRTMDSHDYEQEIKCNVLNAIEYPPKKGLWFLVEGADNQAVWWEFKDVRDGMELYAVAMDGNILERYEF